MSDLFVEVVVAPSFHDEAMAVFAAKKALRVVELPVGRGPGSLDFKRVRGGFLVQDQFQFDPSDQHWTVATERQPTERGMDRPPVRLGRRGLGQVERHPARPRRGGDRDRRRPDEPGRQRRSSRSTRRGNAGHDPAGSVLASDAFFPFADGVDQAAGAGVTRDHPAGRIGARRRGDRGGQPSRRRDGDDRPPPVQTLVRH